MKRLLISSLIGAALLLGLANAVAQQPQRVNYRTTTYVNVPPDKAAAMLDFARTTSRKLIQEEMAAGVNITTFTISRLVFRGEPAAEFNYAVSTVYDGAPKDMDPAKRDEIYKRATGMSFQEYNQKLTTLGTQVGNRLFRIEGSAPAPIKEGSYANVTTWKIAQGRGADYGNYVQNMLTPLNAQAVKEARSSGWMALRVVSPGGPSAPFDAMIINQVKDLSEALPTAPPSPELAQTRFMQVFPKMSYSAFVDQGQALRTLVGTNLFQVMFAVERGGQTLSSSR